VSTALTRFGQAERQVPAADDRINSSPVDRFTLIHVVAGALGSALGVPLPLALVLGAWFEIAENVYQGSFPSIFPNTAPNDSIANSVCDVAAVAAGWTAVELLR